MYKELSKALLKYKTDRRPLVKWIYDELGKVKREDGQSLVNYLKQKDGSKIIDIDPFSVLGIFNRNLSWGKRTEFLQKFKEFFSLQSEVPTDFNGIPTLDPRRAFFFSWESNNDIVIRDQWILFEKVVNDEDIESAFNHVIENGMPKYSLTMCLYWIRPDKYISLDSRNRSFLNTFGFPEDYPILNYIEYELLSKQVSAKFEDMSIPCSSFLEFSQMAWKAATESPCVWMWSGNENTFTQNILKAGSFGKGLDYSVCKTKEELGKAYRNIVGNTDVKIPYAYWDFIHNVKVGDIVVVFSAHKKKYHKLYGWGCFNSDVKYVMEDDNPIQREVEWNYPQPSEPIEETKTKN